MFEHLVPSCHWNLEFGEVVESLGDGALPEEPVHLRTSLKVSRITLFWSVIYFLCYEDVRLGVPHTAVTMELPTAVSSSPLWTVPIQTASCNKQFLP